VKTKDKSERIKGGSDKVSKKETLPGNDGPGQVKTPDGFVTDLSLKEKKYNVCKVKLGKLGGSKGGPIRDSKGHWPQQKPKKRSLIKVQGANLGFNGSSPKKKD